MEDFGQVVFKIDQILEEKRISKNKLEKEAKLQRTQLNSYCNNKVRRIDLQTLAKICYVLDCGIGDIMEYERG
ncbi:helix-turn-helix domain-containing protein [Clostridium cochlearium]|uniref:helix-turn-helix domain-containing protein n=1 Tax=Clostridium cochlearium TaxID=1494 RepID=UPI0022E4D448|nr:helix-turn-helix transcriptional regulator [Clostridium cochlearium]